MLIDRDNITKIIPQRDPFVMVHNLIEASEKNGFTSSFQIQSDNIFLKDGIVSEASLIENIAQTCAAGFGYLNSLKAASENQLGFIGAITKLKVHDVAKLNDDINTNVVIISTFDRIFLIKGEVFCKEKSLIECQMKIVIT
jgi:3-hydroxymyristoyl/3-hydroxydecanoyl-(acyl carrier protein) dehydratase